MGACGGKPKEDDLKEVIPIPILQPGMRKPSLGRAVSDNRYQAPSAAGSRGGGLMFGEDGKAQPLVDQRQAFSCHAITSQNMHHQGGHSHTRLSENEAKKWLLVKEKKDFTRFRMVCFPYAGGNSNFYKTWDFKDTEMVLVELPGRNARYGERVMTDIYAVARKIAQAMDTLGLLESSIPTIFFGHSYGAMCATLTAQVLGSQYGYSLRHLVVSGCVPLHLRAGRPKFSVDSDDDLIASLLDMGGISKDMAKNREVVDQFLPALKGDYLAVDKYSYREESPLGCAVLALGSDNDPRVPAEETQEWGRYTSGPFEYRVFAGGHFFLKASHAEVTAYIASIVLTGPARTASAGLIMYDPNAEK